MEQLTTKRMAERLSEQAMLMRNRAASYRWLAEREPTRRIPTVEELMIYAREAESAASVFEQAARQIDSNEDDVRRLLSETDPED